MPYTLVTAPTEEPISLVEAKSHLRITFSEDDAYISALIVAARQRLESHLSRSFVTTGWRLTQDTFPGAYSQYSRYTGSTGYGAGIGALFGQIPESVLASGGVPFVITKARLIAVSSITYLDPQGTRQTLSPSAYTVESVDGGRIIPAYGTTWPSARAYPGSVVVDMTVGYGSASAVPTVVKQAILLLVGSLYLNREAVSDQQYHGTKLPFGLNYLLATEDWGARP